MRGNRKGLLAVATPGGVGSFKGLQRVSQLRRGFGVVSRYLGIEASFQTLNRGEKFVLGLF
jgi:hypothetical protein